MSLREMLSDYWYVFQQELFPRLEGELGPMGERYELFVAVLELVRVEALLPYFRGQVGRPEEDRAALARAFIAKAVFDVPTTRGLIERLEVDGRLCRLCGWSGAGRLPSEATFSRAFSEFAESGLANRLHETLIARTMDGHLVEHISRDATAIEAREKPAPKPKAAKPKRRKRGRPRKGEARAKEPSRLERQLTMSLPQMLADLPRACDVGTKRNAKGHTTSWIGYKLHVDTADGGIPVSCIMTSASTHDSQVAIPLGTLTAGRVENLYDRLCCKLGEGAMRDQGASCSPYDSALARRSCSHAIASVRAHGPRSKARSTIRASPTMPPWRANIPAWPLRSARITSKPLIVA